MVALPQVDAQVARTISNPGRKARAWACSSVGERLRRNEEVRGSNPLLSTFVPLAQQVERLVEAQEVRRFDPARGHPSRPRSSADQELPVSTGKVGGSIPSGATAT